MEYESNLKIDPTTGDVTIETRGKKSEVYPSLYEAVRKTGRERLWANVEHWTGSFTVAGGVVTTIFTIVAPIINHNLEVQMPYLLLGLTTMAAGKFMLNEAQRNIDTVASKELVVQEALHLSTAAGVQPVDS